MKKSIIVAAAMMVTVSTQAQTKRTDDFHARYQLEDHGVGSSDHFQESVILIMIHYCLNSHIICLDK